MAADRTIFGTHTCTGRDDCEVCHPEKSSEALIARVAALEKDLKAARDALQLLMDVQNGCPLPKYEKDWNEAMEKAKAVQADVDPVK